MFLFNEIDFASLADCKAKGVSVPCNDLPDVVLTVDVTVVSG